MQRLIVTTLLRVYNVNITRRIIRYDSNLAWTAYTIQLHVNAFIFFAKTTRTWTISNLQSLHHVHTVHTVCQTHSTLSDTLSTRHCFDKIKYQKSRKPESNQWPMDFSVTLQSTALPTELSRVWYEDGTHFRIKTNQSQAIQHTHCDTIFCGKEMCGTFWARIPFFAHLSLYTTGFGQQQVHLLHVSWRQSNQNVVSSFIHS